MEVEERLFYLLSCTAGDLIKNAKGVLESNHKMIVLASLGKKRQVK